MVMEIKVVLKTSEGVKEKVVEVSALSLTSELMRLAAKHKAYGVEAYEGDQRIAILDVGFNDSESRFREELNRLKVKRTRVSEGEVKIAEYTIDTTVELNDSKGIVKKYLLDSNCHTSLGILLDRLLEISEAYETVPSDIADAYDNLTETEKWEIVNEISVRGLGW